MAARNAAAAPKFFCNAAQSFGKEMGNGLRFRITRKDGHKPKTKKENHIMKSRKNILTYIVAALSILVTSANSSPAAPEPCEGTVQFTGQSNFQVRQAGTQRSSSSTSPACTTSAWQTARS